MPTGEIDIRINTDGEQTFRALSARLKEASTGGKLNRDLRANLRKAGAPVVGELRAAVQAVVVQSSKNGLGRPHYSRRLRARVASAVRLSVAYKGVRFNVQGALVDEKYGNALAKYLDGEIPQYKAWRHPVFGRDVWTVQYGSPWFFETVRLHAEDFEQACAQAMNDAFRNIAGK